jgi:HSP20 family protein
MLVQFDYPRTCDNLVNDFFAAERMPVESNFPVLDVFEQENDFTVTADIPGVKKEDVKITFENSVLSISGTRPSQAVPENARLLLNELRSGDFNRSLKFRQDIDTSKMSAEMSNGIITIKLPKAESVKAKEIHIN